MIERQETSGRGVEVGIAMCRECNDGQGRILAHFHKGYGDSAEPLAEDELDTIAMISQQHLANTGHRITVIIFHP